MLSFKYMHAVLVAAALIALTWPSAASPTLIAGNSTAPSFTESESRSTSPEPTDVTSTFYRVRADMRRCMSPLCGGYFVKRVNMPMTRCANGRFMPECYVAEIDWNGEPETDVAHALVRGNIVAKRFARFGNLGQLRVNDLWVTLSDSQPSGTYYLVRDRGIRCITFPCATHHEAKLNSSFSRSIAGVKLEDAGLGEKNASIAYAAMTGPDGLIVPGNDVVVAGPGGRSFQLRGTQAYIRKKPETSSTTPGSGSMKPCIKTGCSSQVCADHDVITTCEYRPEYACYRKATCARQRDGNCGFTKTPELTACLSRK
jgi:hypothetical protein